MSTRLPRTLQVLEEGRAARLHLGAQLVVWHRGAPAESLAFGERRPGEPMTDDTLMLWLSAGKPLTVVAVAQQWERGRLDLDEPVAALIPEFAAGGKAGITPRHLLTHTAGLRLADSLPDDVAWEDAVARVCATPLEPGWRVGEQAGYSTQAAWFILGELVRRLDGRPFADYLRAEVTGPAGMADAWVGMPPERFAAYGPRIGTTYNTFTREFVPHPAWDTAGVCARCRPGGGARGPLAGLARFYRLLLAGGELEGRRLLRPETVAALVRPQRTGRFDATFRHVVDFSLGFVLNSNAYGTDTVPYGYGPAAGQGTFGHSGSQCACAFADPENELVVAWACNGLPGEPRHQARQRALNAALYADLGLAPAASPKQAGSGTA